MLGIFINHAVISHEIYLDVSYSSVYKKYVVLLQIISMISKFR